MRQKTSIAGIFLFFIVGVALVNFIVIGSLWAGLFPMNENLHFIYPSLTIVNKTLVAKEPSDTIIRYYLNQNKDKESDWLNFTQGLNLKGRDLRFAHFASSKLFEANLEKAELQGANLWGAELQGANLQEAQLQGVNLCFAELQGAKLFRAKLQRADLWFAKLRGAELPLADLQGAELPLAELQGANLQEAQLQGGYLEGVQLQGADLGKAQLQGIWGKVDLISSINWDELSETVSNQMEGLKAREATLERIKRGKERCAKFNISSQALTSNMAFEQFIAYRIKCTCLSEHVAQGMLDQHKQDWFVKELQNQELSLTNEKFSEDVIEYMSRTCPENAKIWKQWYFYSEWSILFFEWRHLLNYDRS